MICPDIEFSNRKEVIDLKKLMKNFTKNFAMACEAAYYANK